MDSISKAKARFRLSKKILLIVGTLGISFAAIGGLFWETSCERHLKKGDFDGSYSEGFSVDRIYCRMPGTKSGPVLQLRPSLGMRWE